LTIITCRGEKTNNCKDSYIIHINKGSNNNIYIIDKVKFIGMEKLQLHKYLKDKSLRLATLF